MSDTVVLGVLMLILVILYKISKLRKEQNKNAENIVISENTQIVNASKEETVQDNGEERASPSKKDSNKEIRDEDEEIPEIKEKEPKGAPKSAEEQEKKSMETLPQEKRKEGEAIETEEKQEISEKEEDVETEEVEEEKQIIPVSNKSLLINNPPSLKQLAK